MENNNKNLWIGVVVVLIIAIALMFWVRRNVNPVSDSLVGDNSETIVDTVDKTPGKVNVGSTAVTLSYSQALLKYKDARIQLNNNCQASPNNVTFKNGTSIMIDNRAPVARTIKAGQIFSIKAYGFMILKLSSPTLPATWLMDCDKSQNVATILIQK